MIAVAQLVVRKLEDDVKQKLQRRAKRHGRSMEDEVRAILRQAVLEEERPRRRLGSRLAARFARTGLRTEIQEIRRQPARPAELES